MDYALTYPLTIRSHLGVVARCTTQHDARAQILAHFVDLRDNFDPIIQTIYHRDIDINFADHKETIFYDDAVVVHDGNGQPVPVSYLMAHFCLTSEGINALRRARKRALREKFAALHSKGRRNRCGNRGTHPHKMRDHTPERHLMRAEDLDLSDHHLHHLFPKNPPRGPNYWDMGYVDPYAASRSWKAHRSAQYTPH